MTIAKVDDLRQGWVAESAGFNFKLTGHSPNDVLVQPVEKLTYDKNSFSKFNIIKRHETELKWIKLLQTPFPLGINDSIYHEGNIS